MLKLTFLVLLVLGMFMDTGPIVVILAPTLLPVTNAMGINIIHLGVVTVVCLVLLCSGPLPVFSVE